MPNFTGYSTTSRSLPGVSPGVSEDESFAGFWSLDKCRRAYSTYLDSKSLEIKEQQQARRYRHGAQWTSDQIETLNQRKQPVVTYNRIGRKIDGIVGLTERLKQDPKAYPRTPSHQQGADLATAILRYLMDANRWNEKTPIVSEAAAIDGLAGIELDLKLRPPASAGAGSANQQPIQQPNYGAMGSNVVPFPAGSRGQAPEMGHNGGPPMFDPQPDYDVIFKVVDNDGFFYDPRSMRHDFEDARFLGMGKWVDEELLIERMPEFEDIIKSGQDASDLSSNSDRDNRWFQDNGDFKQVRLVDIWYKHGGGWCWTLFTGGAILKQGRSPFRDDYGEEFAKYLMFSSNVDHDGDRYGFARNLMSAQDEINQRRSKGLHELNSRRILAVKAAVADLNVEQLRREGARADGTILVNTSLEDIRFDDAAKQQALMGQLEFLKEAKAEIENFGPNPAVLGDAGIGAKSGRAIQLLQQAGIAELGPYMIQLKAWKIRVYRALFNTAQQYWTQQRWIRIADTMGEQQHVEINGIAPDPMTGMPTMVNPIGQLDVDIVLDEGPDSITVMQDTYDAISQALPAVAKMLGPAQISAVLDVLVETSPLPADVKARFRKAGQEPAPPPPEAQAKQMELQMEQQKNKDNLQFQAAKMQQDGQIKQQQAMADMALEREKAANQAQIERERAAQEIQLEREKTAAQIDLERYKATVKAEAERARMLSGAAQAGL